MADRERQGIAAADDTAARSGDGVRQRYRDALRALARTAADRGLTPAVLTPLYTLNATFYLEAYLPTRVHAAAVAAAAWSLEAACSAALLMQTTNAGQAATPDNGRLAQRPKGFTTLLRDGFTALETSGDTPAGVVALQHALEVAPLLGRNERRAVLAATARWLRTLPAATTTWRAMQQTQRERLAAWAANNARPARAGEVLGWARCLRGGEPWRLLEQALASGLRFGDLLDVLSVAAAAWALTELAGDAAATLIAAHAVRRLSEITGSPALAAWLGVAATLRAATPGLPALPAAADRSAEGLALAAVQASRPEANQLAEAALMEAEALPAALRGWPLHALAAWLDAGGQTTAASAARRTA